MTDATLTARQAICLCFVAVLSAGVVTAGALGRQSIAIVGFGVLLGVTFGWTLQSRRRRGQEVQRLRSELRVSNKALRDSETETVNGQGSFAERRIIAAVENERLAAVERQEMLLSSLRALRKELQHEGLLAGERHDALLAALQQVQRKVSQAGDEFRG